MSDTQNVHEVKDVMENDFPLSVNVFYCINKEVASLLPEDEKTFDQVQWFESKMASIKEFMKATNTWITAVHEGSLQKDDAEVDPQDTVKPSNSISQCGASHAGHDHQSRSHVSRKTTTSRASLNVLQLRRKSSSLSLKRNSLSLKWPNLKGQKKNLSWKLHSRKQCKIKSA